jgi:hypothetical protein
MKVRYAGYDRDMAWFLRQKPLPGTEKPRKPRAPLLPRPKRLKNPRLPRAARPPKPKPPPGWEYYWRD